jgi:hypothetical protein
MKTQALEQLYVELFLTNRAIIIETAVKLKITNMVMNGYSDSDHTRNIAYDHVVKQLPTEKQQLIDFGNMMITKYSRILGNNVDCSECFDLIDDNCDGG